jgi:hypothetical protein
MAQRVRIECIVKDDRMSPYERIQRVGGQNPPGHNPPRWDLPLDDAIRGIQEGKWEFYTHVGGHVRDVIIARSAAGNLYLRTTADRDTPDNLLSLPTCP